MAAVAAAVVDSFILWNSLITIKPIKPGTAILSRWIVVIVAIIVVLVMARLTVAMVVVTVLTIALVFVVIIIILKFPAIATKKHLEKEQDSGTRNQ